MDNTLSAAATTDRYLLQDGPVAFALAGLRPADHEALSACFTDVPIDQ
jgi:hypothetical protein